MSLVLLALVGCGAPELDVPRADSGAPLVVTVTPRAPLDAVQEILRLEIEGASERARAGRFLLFSGELSNYHLGRIRKRDYPKTLLERQVPAQTWVNAELGVEIAPERGLDAGAVYSLASEVVGLVAVLRVRGESPSPFERLWPERDSGGAVVGSGLFVYCLREPRESVVVSEALYVELGPLEIGAWAFPGVDASGVWSERCFHVAPDEPPPENAVLVMPPELYGAPVDPAPIRANAVVPVTPLSCEPHELAFGPGCAEVHDDRLVVRPPAQPLLWVLDVGGARVVHISQPALLFVVRGLLPGVRQLLTATVYDASGAGSAFSLEVETGAVERHVVLNEVLANAVGPEPNQEWVEIVNDGSSAVALSGIVFEDVGGSTPLPDVELAPGQYALLVNESFDPAAGFDVPPAQGAPLLRLPALGKNGLSNSGEPLRLRDERGLVISSFPALTSPTGGVSLARRAPDAPDSDPGSFALHAGDGASPGAPNVARP